MKKVNILMALLFTASLFTFYSCQKEEANIIENEANLTIEQSINTSKALPSGPPQHVRYEGGEYTEYSHPFESTIIVGSGCPGTGICGPLNATLGNGNGSGVSTTTTLNLEDSTLHIEFLEYHVTIDEIIELSEGFEVQLTEDQITESYNTLNELVTFASSARLSREVSESLLGGRGEQINLLAGEYPVDFSNSEFGEITVNIELLR